MEYVRGDRRYTHFFAAITLFSAGMLVMVLAESMVQLILGWEIMGLCSFLLIGHWWEEEANARAALKAFFTVRVGDVGLLVGTAMLYWGSNSWTQENLGESGFSIRAISAWALSGDGSHSLLLWTAVALFIACIGKSGQFPLHTWLPDAMAGPTPVSSLLHSSTMVVAGVYLVARLYPVFWEGFSIPDLNANMIVVVAAITIIISALLAFVQDDIKKVLAYSTVGQLGYMMLGLGSGAWLPAVFHIFTHAFFKCCLFLCAGSVSHSASHHSFDMKKDMGGLWRKMPVTFAAWTASALALAGIFPFAGFFSKDEIIDNVGHNGYSVFMWISLIGAFMTAAYTVRATYLTFFGEPAARPQASTTRSTRKRMPSRPTTPTACRRTTSTRSPSCRTSSTPPPMPDRTSRRSCCSCRSASSPSSPSVSAGPTRHCCPSSTTSSPSTWNHTSPTRRQRPSAPRSAAPRARKPPRRARDRRSRRPATPSSTGGPTPPRRWRSSVPGCCRRGCSASPSTAGVIAASSVSPSACAPLRWGYTFVANKYYLDALYEGVIVHAIAHPIARAAYWFNQHVIDGIVNGIGELGKRIGAWTYRWVDQGVVDGAVNGSAVIAEETGEALRPVQSGRVNQYGALLFGAATVGAIVLVIINV